MEVLTEFMGWLTIVNMVFFIIVASILKFHKDKLEKIHSALFDIEKQDIEKTYFGWLGIYKIIIIAFNLAPYIALVLVSA